MKTIDVIKEDGDVDEIISDDDLDTDQVDDAIATIKAELQQMGVRVSEIGMLFYELKERREGLHDGAKSRQTAPSSSTMRATPPGSLVRNLPRPPAVSVKPNGQVRMKDPSKW